MALRQPQSEKGQTQRRSGGARGHPVAAPVRAGPLPATKHTVPPPTPALVLRRRLHDALAEGLRRPLTLIAAPAGWGKTTLLSGWLTDQPRRAHRLAWVSLDAADNDPVRFWTGALAALQGARPGVGDDALALLSAPRPPPLEAVVTALLNGLAALPTETVLVLDDYHAVEAEPVHRSLAFLLEHLPRRFHLVIATRVDPPLPLARLRARGALAEVRADDLRFTPPEVEVYLTSAMGLRLAPADVAALEARTEGWITGLQLAALAMRGRADQAAFVAAFTGSHRFVVDYLVEEVLAQQPGEVQAFLLQTAILDRLCGPLCDAVTAAKTKASRGAEADDDPSPLLASALLSEGQAFLERLEHANLFVAALDDERRWYRYHHLFAEVLRGRLVSRVPGGTVATLHRRASAWFEGEGLLPEAVEHALAAGAFEDATRLVELAGTAFWSRSALHRALGTWLAALPADVVHARPKLCLLHAWLQLRLQDVDSAVSWVDAARQALRGGAGAGDQAVARAEVAATRAMVEAARSGGDRAQAIVWAEEALRDLPAEDVGLRSAVSLCMGLAHLNLGDLRRAEPAFGATAAYSRAAESAHLALVAAAHLGGVQGVLGRRRAARLTCRESLAWGAEHDAGAFPGAGAVWVVLADLLREQNDLAGAAGATARGVEILARWISPEMRAVSLLAQARARQAQGDISGALGAVDEARQVARHRAAAHLAAPLDAFAAQLRLAQGDLPAAVAWAERAGWGAGPEPQGPVLTVFPLLYGCEHSRIAPAQVLLAQGRATGDPAPLRRALALLEQQGRAAQTAGLPWLRLKALALGALTHAALGEHAPAAAALQAALALGEPEGYVRLFVDEGPPMAALLRRVGAGGAGGAGGRPTGYVALLLAALTRVDPSGGGMASPPHPGPAAGQPAARLIEPLSGRELGVLRLLAAGLTNQEIASELIVSLSTARTHVQHIFEKLGVHDRRAAGRRAKELRLL